MRWGCGLGNELIDFGVIVTVRRRGQSAVGRAHQSKLVGIGDYLLARLPTPDTTQSTRLDRYTTRPRLCDDLVSSAFSLSRSMARLGPGRAHPVTVRSFRPQSPITIHSAAKLALIAASLTAVHAFLGHVSATPNAHLAKDGPLSVVRLARRGLGLGPTEAEDGAEESASLINWHDIYSNASPQAKPLICVVMVFWLVFLFAFVGIAASVSSACHSIPPPLLRR